MDFTDGGTLAILAGVITAIVEIIKAWVPKKYKDEHGLVFKRKNGKKTHIPNQAIWPLLSFAIGIGIFMILKYNIFEGVLPSTPATEAMGGTAAGLGSSGVYRAKNKFGDIFGANPETAAKKTGPETVEEDEIIYTSGIPDDANYF